MLSLQNSGKCGADEPGMGSELGERDGPRGTHTGEGLRDKGGGVTRVTGRKPDKRAGGMRLNLAWSK